MLKSSPLAWPLKHTSLFKFSVLGSLVASFMVVTGCASTQTLSQSNTTKGSNHSNSGLLDSNSLDSLQDLLSATDMRAVEGDRLQILKHGDVWKRMTVGFKMDLDHYDPRIEAQRSWFISRQPYLDRLSARASRYLYHTVKEAERRGMPTELALLPVIESSYDPAATSSAAAAGLWQFIPSTGRIYGLKQNELYDGRRDVVESTRAAYEFLGSLYNQFGSWELALASYNAGPGTVQKAINRNIAAGLPTDYWSLRLPQETMNYVPRFLAVAQIIKDPKAYGVTLPPIANRPHFREVAVSGGVALEQIANVTGLSRAELYSLNPAHRGEQLAPEAQLRLLIPADLNPNIDAKLLSLRPTNSTLLATNMSNTTAIKSTMATPNTSSNASVSSSIRPTITTTTTKVMSNTAQVLQPDRAVPPILNSSTVTTSTGRLPTPRGSAALAAFAASANVPSAPRIPVAVTQAQNIKPVNIEPTLTTAEREQISAQINSDIVQNTLPQPLQAQASQVDKDQVVAEIKAIAPTGTEIVDPLDGKIKLTALQTSLSVAEKKGQEVSKSFAYPKAFAESETKGNSDAAQRNHGKNVIKTATDVVVVPPKGKRSSYTVISGDTLVSIAMKNGVNWNDIAQWNQIDPNKTLYVGSTLYLYDAKAVGVKSTKPESYIVKSGDNLTTIASQFDLDLADVAEWNDLSNTSKVYVGQKLSLMPSKNSKKIKTETYTVKRGDNVNLLAQRFDLTTAALADLTEGLNANSRLQAGQKINVPAETKNTKSTTPELRSENYTVKRGETLSSIADKFKLNLSELRDLNNLRSKSINVGQTLKIPAENFKPDVYVVKSGDNLTQIADRYGLDLAALASQNGLKLSSGLQVGQRLDLEVTAAGGVDDSLNKNDNKMDRSADSKSSKSSRTQTARGQTESYVVKSGESWNSIAQDFELSGKELAELNGTTTHSALQRGQQIDVPKLITEYKVKRGDTLLGLANKYGIDNAELAKMNGLKTSSLLQIGDIIKVPN